MFDVELVANLGPTLRNPILLRLAGADDYGSNRPAHQRPEAALPHALVGPWTKVPHDRLVRHSQCRQELEVLILHVLNGTRGNFLVREEPVEIARAGPVETHLDP